MSDALSEECTSCGSKPGNRCRKSSWRWDASRATSRLVDTGAVTYFHAARVRAAEREEREERGKEKGNG